MVRLDALMACQTAHHSSACIQTCNQAEGAGSVEDARILKSLGL